MNKRIAYALLAILVATAGYYFLRNNEKDNSSDHQEASNQPLPSSVRVSARRAEVMSLLQQIDSEAALFPVAKGEIVADIASKVEKILVFNGQKIHASDTLVSLASELYVIALDKARGDFFKALTEFISELKLIDQRRVGEWDSYLNEALENPVLPPLPNSLSRSKFMSVVRYDLHNLFALVKQAEQKLKQCVVTAPFDGVVSGIQVYPGAGVSPGTVLLTLTDLSRIRVEIEVLETDLPYIHPGTPFQFVDSPADTFFVDAILPEIDPQTRCGKAVAIIRNDNMVYKDGQKVMVKLVKQVFRDRLVVPRSAILTRNDRDLVFFVVKRGIAKWQYVATGVGNMDFVEILKGVAAGDTIVTRGHYSLAHDVPVAVKIED
jgi:multidrug efflux pump subunit AcrA (membrane-fusion protein)